jgi:hypothetical protein
MHSQWGLEKKDNFLFRNDTVTNFILKINLSSLLYTQSKLLEDINFGVSWKQPRSKWEAVEEQRCL